MHAGNARYMHNNLPGYHSYGLTTWALYGPQLQPIRTDTNQARIDPAEQLVIGFAQPAAPSSPKRAPHLVHHDVMTIS